MVLGKETCTFTWMLDGMTEYRGPSIHFDVDDDEWLCIDDEEISQSSAVKRAYIVCLELVGLIIISEFQLLSNSYYIVLYSLTYSLYVFE